MKIVELNTVHYGSTGKIMLQIANCARQKGHEVYTFSRAIRKRNTQIDFHSFFGGFFESVIHRVFGEITGREGIYTYFGTRKIIKKIMKISPEVIHIHNIHGWYLDFKALFKYIKKSKVNVVWTLHDCWAFTGHCPYFDMVGCEKWKTGCCSCAQYRSYPRSLFDNSKKMYTLKKKWFTGVDNMVIVTPSKWLAELVQQSFLKDYPVRVINNGIDLNVFRPRESEFREKYNCQEKFVLLGVAFDWGTRKGLDVFIELAKRLDERFQIVLVGTNEKIEKQLPSNIISIKKTQNQIQLAEIYSAADLFVNPTREDNYPTVNMESIACGTPVVTFDTGGSPEMVDALCGKVVEKNDIDALEKEIICFYQNRASSRNECLEHAARFDMNDKFKEYTELYEEARNA